MSDKSKSARPPKPPRMVIRIHPDQRLALEEVAINRDTTATALIRDFIGSLTGVKDPLPRYPRRGPAEQYRNRMNKTTT